MKTLYKIAISSLFILLVNSSSVKSQVSINTTGDPPNSSAMLDVKSTSKGMLMPRMTMVQRDAITTPATGLMIYQTDNIAGVYCNSGTSSLPVWTMVGGNAGQWMTDGTNIYYNSGNVGIGIGSPAALFHTYGTGIGQGNIMFIGQYKTNNPGDPPVSGAGTRMMWYPDKAAFRAGYVDGAQWNAANIGDYSTAMGYNTTASGQFSFATGYLNMASGEGSASIGTGNNASGSYSNALGEVNTASGDFSTALGYSTTASGDYSFTMGNQTSASGGDASAAIGYRTTASGNSATALGNYTTALSFCETVIGKSNTTYTPISATSWEPLDRLFVIGNNMASGLHNAMTLLKNGNVGIGTDNPTALLHTQGTGTGQGNVIFVGEYKPANAGDPPVSGSGARMMWYADKAAFRAGYWDAATIGDFSAGLGCNTTASGQSSTALGYGTTATGVRSIAMGSFTTASGYGSITGGAYTTAPSTCETVLGFNNTTYTPSGTPGGWNINDRLFVIGNGWSGSHNAMTVLKSGNTGIGTDIPTQLLDVDGNARFRSIGSGAYEGPVNRTTDGTLTTATSDRRLKENITTLQDCLGKVLQLRGVSFTWKTNPEYGTRIGFVAQEFEKVIPELVFTNPVDGYKGINYAEVSAVLAEAIKELKAENDLLKAKYGQQQTKIETMESRLSKLESMLEFTSNK
jgi:hypothetical protein